VIIAVNELRGRMTTSLPGSLTEEIRAGRHLAGDDYSPTQIERWFAEEKEAFFVQDDGNSATDPFYAYMRSLTPRLAAPAFSYPAGQAGSLLVLGPGPGLEVDDIVERGGAWKITFVEASESFRESLVQRFPGSTVVPARHTGVLEVRAGCIDVAIALSVLHHIPNVSFVLGELSRVTRTGGYVVIREPCSSMGDWRGPRSATPNERGISKRWMVEQAQRVGLSLAMPPKAVLFHPLSLVAKRLGVAGVMKTRIYFWLDIVVSKILEFNDAYWRDAWYKKLAPSAYFYVFRKTA
jgi:SAM-dependent methyltransferase